MQMDTVKTNCILSTRMILLSILLITLSVTTLFSSCNTSETPVEASQTKTIVSEMGKLQVIGNKILDQNGNTAILRGMSLFWSQMIGQYYNEQCISWLRDDWKCTVVRAAIGVEGGGYLENPGVELQKAFRVIDACINNGIYVIVDWHDHRAELHLEQAKTFFRTIANKYGNKPNLIYEIYNEPLLVSWKDVVKPYAEAVIAEIRKVDPDNLILVGSPTWSQDVDIAARDPIVDPNLAYTLHFYTGTHKQDLRDKAATALNLGAALFVSEFGISEASGDGAIDYQETQLWTNFLDQNKLSWCNWSVADKNETSAALKSGAAAEGGWPNLDLTESGLFIRNMLITRNQEIFDSLDK